MKDVVNFLISVIVLCVLVAVFSVYGPQVASERTGGNWLMAGDRPGSTPGKGEGEGEGESPVSFLFTPGQATKGTAQPEENTGSAFSLTVTVEKVKEQIESLKNQAWEVFLCGVAVGMMAAELAATSAAIILFLPAAHKPKYYKGGHQHDC